jgi:hypothetical protein
VNSIVAKIFDNIMETVEEDDSDNSFVVVTGPNRKQRAKPAAQKQQSPAQGQTN